MKIILINPKMSLRPMDSEYKRRLSPPLGLLTIGALTPQKHEIKILDENVKKINYNEKADLVGITVNVNTSNRAYKISQEFRARGIPVILGGIHVSANPNEALKYSDSVCIGEVENVWENILYDTENKNLQQVYFSKGPTDLEKVPIPRWELIDRSKYLYTNIIYTSRNCPFRCDFCYNSCEYTENFRNRPIHKIIEEIQIMKTKHVMFIDDNFIGNIQWTKDFLNVIKGLSLKWNAAVSTNIVNHIDLLDLMEESGCQSLFIGFENINQESLRSVRKYQNRIDKFEVTVQV